MFSSRVNYPSECEQALNQTIEFLQSASLTYDLLGAACSTEEISMPGFCRFYRMCSLRSRKLSEKLIEWQTTRGGKMLVNELKPFVSSQDLWQQGLEKLVEIGVDIERRLEEQWRHLYRVSKTKEDWSTAEYVQREFMIPQVVVIKMVVDYANGLKLSKNYYIYDRKTMMHEAKLIRRCVEYRSEWGWKSNSSEEKGKWGKTNWPESIWSFTKPIV